MKIGDTYWYVIPLNPVPWAVGPLSIVNRGGKKIPYIGQNTELKMFQDAVKASLAAQQPEMLDSTMPYKMQLWFWRNISPYTSHQARSARSQEADLTNLQKGTEDALHGVIFKNDKNNVIIASQIVRQDPDTEGKVIIAIEEIALSQVFDTVSQIPDILTLPNTVVSEEPDRWKTSDEDF